jgi:hypothetical protein
MRDQHDPINRNTDFRQINGPSVRVVIDVGNWDNTACDFSAGILDSQLQKPLLRPARKWYSSANFQLLGRSGM